MKRVNYMDIKSLTQLLQLSMMKSITSDDSGNSQGLNDQSGDTFELLLQELIQDPGAINTGSTSTELLDPGSYSNNSSNDTISGVNNSSNININQNIENAVDSAAQKYGVDPDFIKAVIKQESGFHANAVSGAGAEGLMQLMPKTAESLGVKNPFDVLENIDGGTKYIKNLLNSFGGNKELALSAYNGGIGRMNRLGVDTVDEISNMPKETQNYVEKVMKNYENYKRG